MTTATTITTPATDLISIFEDNAGGLSLLRHSDNAVFIGLERIYSNDGSTQGALFSQDETEYWLTADADTDSASKVDDWHYRNSDGHDFRFEPDGLGAECFDRDGQTPNGINLIATYNGSWTAYPDRMGTNALIATGNN